MPGNAYTQKDHLFGNISYNQIANTAFCASTAKDHRNRITNGTICDDHNRNRLLNK